MLRHVWRTGALDHMWISPGLATTSGRNAIRNGHPKWLMAA